jgi:hypothetical protein
MFGATDGLPQTPMVQENQTNFNGMVSDQFTPHVSTDIKYKSLMNYVIFESYYLLRV